MTIEFSKWTYLNGANEVKLFTSIKIVLVRVRRRFELRVVQRADQFFWLSKADEVVRER